MNYNSDYDIGYEDAAIAAKHLYEIGDTVNFKSILEYIYKNFGLQRYLNSEDSYKKGVYDVSCQYEHQENSITSPYPSAQEIHNEGSPTSTYY